MRTEMSVDRVELVAVLCSVLSDPQTIVKNETFRKLWSRLQLCLNWCFLGMQITETIKPTTHRAAALSLHYNVSSSSLNHERVNGTEHDKNLSAKPTKPPSNLRLAFVFWLFGYSWLGFLYFCCQAAAGLLHLILCLLNLSTRAWHLHPSRGFDQMELCCSRAGLDERHQAGICTHASRQMSFCFPR